MQIHEAAEMYLETILILSQQKGQVRSIDIVNQMNYSKPTVSVVMKEFRKDGYIKMDNEGYITLTKSGRDIAQGVYERHQLISSILIALGVEEEIAVADACKIEHDISDATFFCLKEHYKCHHK